MTWTLSHRHIIYRVLALIAVVYVAAVNVAIVNDAHADDTPVITWVKNDAPPFYVTAPALTAGIGDTLQALYEQALPQYQHTTLHVPLGRLEHTWQTYQPLCFATMIHGEPINDGYQLSRPNLLYMPHGIITTEAHADTLPLNERGQVKLTQLLSEHTVKLGQNKGRTYSPRIDQLLAQYRDNLHIETRAGSAETFGVLTMLEHGRFDVMIEYEFVLNDYVERTRKTGLRFLPIAESEGDHIWGAIGCTNSPAGEAALAAINAATPEVMQHRRYRRNVGRWLVPVGQEIAYWEEFQRSLESPSQIAAQSQTLTNTNQDYNETE